MNSVALVVAARFATQSFYAFFDDDGNHDKCRDRIGPPPHQNRTNDPVLNKGQTKDFPVTEDVAEILVTYFRQRRVHHEYQAYGYGDVGCSNLKAIDGALDAAAVLPRAIPIVIAANIQTVRYLSRNERCALSTGRDSAEVWGFLDS